MDNASLSTSLLALAAMVVAMAALPWLLRRWQQRSQAARGIVGVQAQMLGSLALGPGQRVVTVEVAQGEHKACLVLGVTAHNIHCLHVLSGGPTVQVQGAPEATSFAQALDAQQPGAVVQPALKG